MKADKLMVGDWVMHPNYGKIQIKAIPNTDATYSPIPLTAEILEKNDLWHSRVSDCYDEWVIDIYSYSSWWLLNVDKTIDEGYEYSIDAFPFKYVHELQHCLRLCGLDGLADDFQV